MLSSPRRHRRVASAALLFACLAPGSSRASFHLAEIREVLTSFNGDANVQFVEIAMLSSGQNLVHDTVLAAFDRDGNYLQDVLVVPGDVPNSFAPWLMATAGFQALTGFAPDFVIPAALPTQGGMVCWGAPGVAVPPPASWDHTNPANFVDCLAYGSYRGPVNTKTGIPTRLDADGHSLVTMGLDEDAMFDTVCSQLPQPERNDATAGVLGLGAPCPAPRVFTPNSALAFSGPGDGGTISGHIRPASPDSDSVQMTADCIFDTCFFPSDGIYFQIELDPGSADLYYGVVTDVSTTFVPGHFVAPGHLVDSDSSTRAPMGTIFTAGSQGVTFDDFNAGNQLQSGETSDVLFLLLPFGFLSYVEETEGLAPTFTFSPFSFGNQFTAGPVTLSVPEPTTAWLRMTALLALLGLTSRGRRRMRRREPARPSE